MKECKILYLDYNGGCVQDGIYKSIGNVRWEEFPNAEKVINQYINKGFSVKNISAATSQNPPNILIYLEKNI